MLVHPGGESRRSLPRRFALLIALLGLALAAGTGSPRPVAATETAPAAADRSAVPSSEVPVAVAPVPAAVATAPTESAASGDAEPVAPSPRPRRRLSPMAAELSQTIESEREALTELQARFDRAISEREALAVQREIEQLKTQTEIALLRIQAKHARIRGREAVAQRIDAAIEEILHPPVARNPVARPAPVEPDGGR